jgi:hypothetical protein
VVENKLFGEASFEGKGEKLSHEVVVNSFQQFTSSIRLGRQRLCRNGVFRLLANTRAERNAPIAPVVPKAFEEFGGVRIDNYDWLRDRKDPRVLAYLEAENTYADARLTTIKPLVDDLAAELKVRSAQEDASVPAADNGYLYERRFAQGAQYPLTKATARRIQRIRRQ